MSWEPEEEYVRVKGQRGVQRHINPGEFHFYFACWSNGLTRKRTFKSHLEETETAVYCGHKE